MSSSTSPQHTTHEGSGMGYVVLLGSLFGTTLVASRFSVGQFQPAAYVGLRLTIAALAFLSVYALSSGRHFPRDRTLLRHSAVLGVFGTALPMFLLVTALQYQSAGVTGLLLTTAPAFTILFAHFLLPDERLSGRKILGVLLALGGAGLLVASGQSGLADPGRANPIGYVLAITAIIINALMTIYARKYMRHMDSLDASAVRLVVAAAVALPAAWLLIGFDLSAVNATGVAVLLYAALVGTFAGLLLGFYVTRHYGATAYSMTAYIIPIVAAAGGVILLDETFTVIMLLGLALIIAGIALINRKRPQAVEMSEI